MKSKLGCILIGLGVLVLISRPVFAHHGYAAYDMTKVESVQATIVELLLQNPHSTVSFDVVGTNGTVEHWYSEGGNPRAMKAEGYTPDNIKPGDKVTVFFHPSKTAAHVVVLTRVEFPDGRVLPLPRQGGDETQ